VLVILIGRLLEGCPWKITDVEAMIFKSSHGHALSKGSEESHGMGYLLVIELQRNEKPRVSNFPSARAIHWTNMKLSFR
jgi:hypothetical protein